MNLMTKRLEALEMALVIKGGDCIRCFIRKSDDETQAQARERLGLTDWPGILILMEEGDTNA